jgi:2-oxo-4-hydroxy-4-carboxy-5-ureidoimidazoline decarboxylase
MGETAEAPIGPPAGDSGQAPAAERGPLGQFNALPPEGARRELLACCAAEAWAERVAAARPYGSVAAALHESDAAVAVMTNEDLMAALAGHPRIGERRLATEPGAGGTDGRRVGQAEARAAAWSSQEQAGMRGADQQVSQAMAELNRAYEDRFGHVYLVCATGRSAAELLDLLRGRLGNDAGAERMVVRSELAQINQLRLRKLLADTTAGATA